MPSAEVLTYYNKDMIISKLQFNDMPYRDGLIKDFSCRVINLQDQGVRKALIELGWTPPAEEKDIEKDK